VPACRQFIHGHQAASFICLIDMAFRLTVMPSTYDFGFQNFTLYCCFIKQMLKLCNEILGKGFTIIVQLAEKTPAL
jgi:hypothetical protein